MQDYFRLRIIVLLALFASLMVIVALLSDRYAWVFLLVLLSLAIIVILSLKALFDEPPLITQDILHDKSSRQKFLQELLKSISVPFFVLSSSGRIMFMSTALRNHFPMIAKGDHYAQITRSPRYGDAVRAALDDQAIEPFTFEIHRDTHRVFEAYITPLKSDLLGEVDAKLLVELFDRTDEHRSDIMRRDFIANAGHELRTPLSSILGGIETLSASHDVKTLNRFLPVMEREATRMKRLIEDLMSLSNVELNEHTPPETLVNLREVIAISLEAMRAQNTFENVDIDNQFQQDESVRADHDQLQQVVMNIVDNAVKYGGESPKITIKRRADDQRYPRKIGISIADDGSGIAARDISRLTERFYRVSKQSSLDKGGTGLGLAIVKHILLRHQGELQIESRINEGSTFTIWLPYEYNN